MAGLRAPTGGVKVAKVENPAETMRRRLIDLWVADYDAALKAGDQALAGRTASALREMGVRI